MVYVDGQMKGLTPPLKQLWLQPGRHNIEVRNTGLPTHTETVTIEAGKKEELKLDRYGKVATIKMEPKGKFNGMFVRKGRMFLWISDDARYTICRATASVPVASIKIVLKKVRGPGDDFWTREPPKK